MLVTVGFVANPGAGLAQSRRPDSLAARVDSIFALWNKSNSPGCMLGVSRNGNLVYERGYGMANLEDGVPITPASIFHVASVTKQFTAMSILILARRGRLSLDDEVRKYITELPDYGSPLTLRHLLTHTSGLRNAFTLSGLAEPRDRETEDLVKILARQKALNFTPGSEYPYLNDGYGLLGLIVERVSGQSLRGFMDSNIFKPLGMTHSFLHDAQTMIVPNRAVGYDRDDAGNLIVAVDQWRIGAGGNTGLYTTTRDLLIWEQNFAEVRVGDQALVAAMQSPTVLAGGDTGSYGLGLFIGRDRGLRVIGHDGGDPGYVANVVRYPDQALVVAVLCNLENINPIALPRSVARIYLADVLPPDTRSAAAVRPTVSLPAEQLASKVGLYRNPVNDDLRRIWILDGKLMAIAGGGIGSGVELTPVGRNRFLVSGDGTVLFEFVPAAAGRAQEIRRFAEGQQPLVFQQVNPFTPSSAELRAFAGEYVSPELETKYTLAVRDSGLVVQIRGRAEIVLRPAFADAFWGSRVGVVKFSRDSGGVVTGFTISTGGVRRLPFDRVKR